MKKAGFILAGTGFITALLAGILFYEGLIKPFPFYMSMMLGFIFIPLGSSFLSFHLPPARRKKIATIGFIVAVLLILGGKLCQHFEIMGARIEIICGVVIFCFYFGSLSFKNKFEKWNVYTRSKKDAFFLSLFDFSGLGLLFLGELFKIQHWPWGDIMLNTGLVILVIGMFAWNHKFKKEVVFRKEAEDKVKESLVKIEESHKEIRDSINYAKRLQDAILPDIDKIKKTFPEIFVLYKPKDIVAGDFYWFENKNGASFLAAADCTGHGVPGAMVSVVCSNALNRVVSEMEITDPGKILDKVNELVEETFQKNTGEIKDGMDISLLSVKMKTGNQEEKILKWAGANNPLWIVRENKLLEFKADKQPIGHYENRKAFTTHEINIEKGDAVYLFTDGYADQFGGPKGKKFKYKQISDKLVSISNKKMNEQKKIMEEILENWKGNLEQVDDVCIIGIRF